MNAHKNFTAGKNPDLIVAHLGTVSISTNCLKKGTIWNRGKEYKLQADYYLTEFLNLFTENATARVVVSFQQYPNQEYVAVARLHRELIV